MEEIIAGNVEQLCENVKGKDIYIYGAKSVALRTCKCLEIMGGGTRVLGYVVSNRYDNPKQLYGKKVYRIEEENRHYDCMILAVKGGILWQVRDEIVQYDIDKLVIISPLMNDAFKNGTGRVLSDKCKISDKACIAEDVQIVADETSSIVIDDYVVLGEGCAIIATDNSHIHIGERSWADRATMIMADKDSNIELSPQVKLGKKCNISAGKNSEINIGKKVKISYNCVVCSGNSSTIRVGEDTTFCDNLYMVSDKSQINIGKDCMFSYYVKMNVGNHRLLDRIEKDDITNITPIEIGNHVWCGINVTLLPGCRVEDGSVIGASAVVNKHIPSNSTCAGNPVRVLRNDIEWFR